MNIFKNTTRINNEDGFAMILALLTLLILTSLCVLVFTMTSKDLLTSVRASGEKICRSASEAGVEKLILTANTQLGNITTFTASNVMIDNYSSYSIVNGTGNVATKMPGALPLAGFEMGGTGATQNWSQKVFNKTIAGKDSRFNGEMDVDVAIGYGPVDMSTSQPASGG